MDRTRRDFKDEGVLEIGPRADFFIFFDGEYLGRILSDRAGIEPKAGEYTRLGRARITVEWLEDDATREASST